MAACRELEHKKALRAALLKEYSNFDDRSCLQYLDWLCDPANYGRASHGDVSRALQNIEVENLLSRQILDPDNDFVHPSGTMPSSHQSWPVLPKSVNVLQRPVRLHYTENEETIRKLAKRGKAAWRNQACTGRKAQKVKAGTDLQCDVAKQTNIRTFPDFARYCECMRVDINTPHEQVSVCRTID